MWNSIIARIHHFQDLWREGIWGRWMGLIYGVAALFVFIRDEIWQPANEAEWRVVKMIPHLTLAWWLFGFSMILCIWLFEASFRKTKRLNDIIASLQREESPNTEQESIQTQLDHLRQQHANLNISGPCLHKDLRYLNQNQWRMKVHNAGPGTARDVKIRLKGGAAEPNDSNWTGDYPYAVYPVGTIKNDPGHIMATERQISVNDDERYEITCGWKSQSGQFFTDVNTKGGGHNNIQICLDERWKFDYEVTAENASSIRFRLEIFIEDDEVKVAMVN